VECHNTVFGSKRSAICAQAVYFLHSTMPNITCLRLSDVSVICHVTYFQFPIQVCFTSMSVSQAAQRHTWFTQYRTSDVAENFGRQDSCTERTSQRQFSKFCSKRFHRDTDRGVVFKFREIWPTGNRWNRALITSQNFACLSNCRFCADCAQNLPGLTPNNVLRVLQISSKSVHFRRSYSRMREHRQIAP